MKTRKSIEKQLSELSEQDTKTLQAMQGEIDMILSNKKINEDLLIKLANIITTVTTMKDNYMWRLLRAAKQNHMLD